MQVKELEINLSKGAKIYGELDSPQGNGPWKTIILFHGSGAMDRHATVEGIGQVISCNFELLSERFVQAGYAVFRYDKRESYDINIIIQDARAVTQFIKELPDVSEILFYGWSEGVRVCTTLISEFPEVRALLLQSGLAEGWSSYFAYILQELTVEKFKELDKNGDGILELADFASCMPDLTSITFSLYLLVLNIEQNGNRSFKKELDPKQTGSFSIKENWLPLTSEIVANPTTLTRFVENAPEETWTGILDDIGNLQIPVLVLHGLNDGRVSPVESVKIAKTIRNHADVVLFKGLGHSLSKVDSPLKDEGGVMEEEAIMAIVGWLKKNIG